MNNAKIKVAFDILIVLIALGSISATTGAQLGEIAGQLTFQVQVGHTQTLQLSLINEGNQSIPVQISPPTSLRLTSNAVLSANQTPPTVTASPLNATILPHSELQVNVTVSMPLNDTPYVPNWEGIISVQEVSNQSNPGGAVILEGVAKIFTAAPIPSTTTSTTSIPTTATAQGLASPTTSSSLPIIAVIILIIILIAAYYIMKSGKKPGKKTKAKASSESMEERLDRLEKQNQQLRRQVSKRKGSSKTKKKVAKPKAKSKKKTTRRRRR